MRAGLSGKDWEPSGLSARHEAKALVTILSWAHGDAAASSVLAASSGAFMGNRSGRKSASMPSVLPLRISEASSWPITGPRMMPLWETAS
jgi:hypothetical protein